MARAEEVARRIERRIRDGEVEAGERIGTRRELRISHGVSAGTINETVRLLQARGLVEARSGHQGGIFATDRRAAGAAVRMPDAAIEAAPTDRLAIRGALEPLVLREAARAHTAAGAAGWRRLLDLMEAALDQPERFERIERSLRVDLAGHCRNSVLQNVYLTFLEPLGPPVSRPETRERLRRDRAMIEAVLSADPGSSGRAAAPRPGSRRPRRPDAGGAGSA
jgi:DNA-binding FadR family transcriptional regulator